MTNENIYWICNACAKRNGGKMKGGQSWWNLLECDCCKKVVAVTKVRNWNFNMEKKECVNLC